MTYDVPPLRYWMELPEVEHDQAIHIGHLLRDLSGYIDRFRADVSLLEFSMRRAAEAKRQLDSEKAAARADETGDAWRRLREWFFEEIKNPKLWMDVAGSDGALTIHDFHRAMIALVKARDSCAVLKSLANGRQLEQALQRFSSYFPNAKHIRHAKAHVGDMNASPDELKRNSFTGNYDAHGIKVDPGASNTTIRGTFGNKIVVTIYGKIHEYELSSATAERLVELAQICTSAFTVADESLRESMYKRLEARRAAPPPPANQAEKS